MAVSAKLYGQSAIKALNGSTYKVMLLTSAYTPNQDTHTTTADLTGEVTGTGYTAGGATLANPTKTYTAATNVYKFDGDDTVWASSTITARYAVIVSGTDLLGYVDFGADVSSNAGSFTITWDAAGIATVTFA